MPFTFSESLLDQKEESAFEPGEYSAEVTEVVMDVTKNGNKQMTLRFKTVDSGVRLCNDRLYVSDKAKVYTLRKLKALGLEKDENGEYQLSDEGQELVGKRVSLTLIHDDNPKYLTPDFSAKGHGYAVDDIGF